MRPFLLFGLFTFFSGFCFSDSASDSISAPDTKLICSAICINAGNDSHYMPYINSGKNLSARQASQLQREYMVYTRFNLPPEKDGDALLGMLEVKCQKKLDTTNPVTLVKFSSERHSLSPANFHEICRIEP